MSRPSGMAWRLLGAVAGLLLLGTGCSGPSAGPGPDAAEFTPGPAEEDHDAGTRAADLPRWRPIEGLRVPRDDFATAVVGDEVWAMGGMTGDRGNRLRSIEVLDTSEGQWRTAEVRLPLGLASFEAVAVGRRIYAFGGFDVGSRETDFSGVLDTTTGRWRRLPPLPHPRYAHTVTLHQGRIYVIGGRAAAGPVEHIDVFDPARRTWRTLGTTMPAARDSHDTVSVPEGLMVVGGWLVDGPTDRVDVFDPVSGRWSTGPDVPVAMSRAGVTVAKGRVWVSLHRTSYVLSLDGSTGWRPANALPLSRHGLGYVRVGEALYAIAGCSESPLRDVRTVDRLDLGAIGGGAGSSGTMTG